MPFGIQPVALQDQGSPPLVYKVLYLEHFDLAAGGAHVFSVFSMLAGCKGVYLNAERDALFSTMFSRSELSANAVYLYIKKQRCYCW